RSNRLVLGSIASGRSMVERCPQSATTTNRDPATQASISCESACGVSSSPSPTSTSVGHLIAGNNGRAFRPRHDRLLLAQERLRSGFLGHEAHARAQRFVALPVAMDEYWKLQRRHLGESAGLGERNLRLATRGLLRRFGSRRGVEQRKPLDALGRVPHDCQSEVAPHREPGERKALGAAARMRLAIASMLASRVWSATCTGPNRHSTGTCSAYTRD